MKNIKLKNSAFVFLFYIVILSSCINERKEAFKSYFVFYNYFNEADTSLVSHFPKEIDYSISLFRGKTAGSSSKSFGYNLHLVVFYDSQSDRISNEKFAFKYKIEPLGECNLIVPWFSPMIHEKREFEEHLDSLLKICDKLSPPIPNFSYENKILKLEGSSRLPDDFVIYVIDSKPGRILESSYQSEGYGLPHGWRNGYSRGIAISKKRQIVIYWVEVW